MTYWVWYHYLINPPPIKNATLDTVPTKDDWLIVFQPYSADRREIVEAIIDRFEYSKRVLIHYEGRYRQPHGFKLRYQQKFGRIYTYSSTDVDGDTIKYMPIPLWVTLDDCKPIGNRSKLICSVVTNCNRDREPRGIIIEKFKNLGMDIYGGAGKPVPGDTVVSSVPGDKVKLAMNKYQAKLAVMSDYTFAFAIENQLDLGHVTEKPFDAIAAGCIPVYLGPLDACKFIPKSCYIDYRDFWSEVDVMNYIRNLSKERIQEYQRSIMTHQKTLVGMRTFESCMRFLCKDLGIECEAPYYSHLNDLSVMLLRG
ncbi:MAG: glycosyltransferase family 10 [Nitrosarchaeum sp.]|nr:glycosyltransferase family 10 [Nitrosarchaeum sp.]